MNTKRIRIRKIATASLLTAAIGTMVIPAQNAQAASSQTQRARIVWNYLRDQGYSKKATAGILGNMDQESGINPASVSGSCYGLIQWTGSRKTRLYRYARKCGTGSSNMNTQLKYLTKKDCANLKANMASHDSSVSGAARYFEQRYERAGKPMMSRRIAKAQKWYNKFA